MSANKFIQNNKKLSAQYQKAVELSEKYNHAEYYAYAGSLTNKQMSEYAPYFDKLNQIFHKKRFKFHIRSHCSYKEHRRDGLSYEPHLSTQPHLYGG